MNRVFFSQLILLICIGTIARSQSRIPPITAESKQRYEEEKKIYNNRIGTILSPFVAISTTGVQITNESLIGKVTLLLFWNPWCNCFQPDKIKEVQKITANRKDFQIISMMWDTGRLHEFEQQYGVKMQVAKLPNQEMERMLSGGEGIPSYLLLDKNGIMVLQMELIPYGWDEERIIAKLKELLLH